MDEIRDMGSPKMNVNHHFLLYGRKEEIGNRVERMGGKIKKYQELTLDLKKFSVRIRIGSPGTDRNKS